MSALPDAEALYAKLLGELRGQVKPDAGMIGIHTGGAWLAERLHADLGLREPLGTLDISFYRDDFNQQGLARDPKRTRIPFSVEGRQLYVVDDVLYTGRTVRAAMNELFDYGRPAGIALIVLADRGGRQLPICAQHLGARLECPADARLRLKRAADGTFTLAIERAA